MNTLFGVAFLVINRIEKLPELAIESALKCTEADILIGYIRDGDLPEINYGQRVKLIKLDTLFNEDRTSRNETYRDFSEDAFYQVVQYKWQLLQSVFNLGYEFIIYSDTDVYWNENPIPELLETFHKRNNCDVLIQSFTDNLSDPKLCMGFVAFRNSAQSISFVSECKQLHESYAKKIGRIGDDDIVTAYYIDNEFPAFICELPQTTFPVGRALRFYSKNSIYPGLPKPTPYIFHANYVIGISNKVKLMKIFIRNYSTKEKGFFVGSSLFFAVLFDYLRLQLSLLKLKFLN